MDEKQYSKSLKKNLSKKYEDDLYTSLVERDFLYEPLKNHISEGLGDRHTVKLFEKKVYFPINFREALKKYYSKLVRLYTDGVKIHNEHIAGSTFPTDAFEWFNTPEVAEIRNESFKLFSEIGKQLAHKKRRQTAFEAQQFLMKNVLTPLDSFTWESGARLDFLFEHAIDIMCQSYLSEFVKDLFDEKQVLNERYHQINYDSISKNKMELEFLHQQIRLYNIQDYILMENTIKNVVSQLPSFERVENTIKEQMLFDIFELIPLYIKNWDPLKHRIDISDEISLFIFLDFGFPSFVIGKPYDQSTLLKTSCLKFSWNVNHDFTSMGKLDCEIDELFLLGDYVLEKLHDQLLSLFSLRKSQPNLSEETEGAQHENPCSELIELGEFTLEYHQALSQKSVINTDTSMPSSFVPSISMSAFFSFMKSQFDCKVEQGKGSEMKIWREGSHIYTIGRHKRDPKLHSFLIKKVIKRLGIPKEQWLEKFVKY